MSWSVMYANVSMSVTPGSDTLWSVHSGQRRWTSRLASSTRFWNRRSSRFGTGNAITSLLFGYHVEGKHQAPRVVRTFLLIDDMDIEGVTGVFIDADLDALDLDSRLPERQSPLDFDRQQPSRGGIGRGKHIIVDPAPEL